MCGDGGADQLAVCGHSGNTAANGRQLDTICVVPTPLSGVGVTQIGQRRCGRLWAALHLPFRQTRPSLLQISAAEVLAVPRDRCRFAVTNGWRPPNPAVR